MFEATVRVLSLSLALVFYHFTRKLLLASHMTGDAQINRSPSKAILRYNPTA